jgi:hypothetical protein
MPSAIHPHHQVNPLFSNDFYAGPDLNRANGLKRRGVGRHGFLLLNYEASLAREGYYVVYAT